LIHRLLDNETIELAGIKFLALGEAISLIVNVDEHTYEDDRYLKLIAE